MAMVWVLRYKGLVLIPRSHMAAYSRGPDTLFWLLWALHTYVHRLVCRQCTDS